MTIPELARALIVDPAFLGDVVFDGPLVRAIQARWPGCEVGIVVRPPAQAIGRRMAGVRWVHAFDKRGADRGWRGLTRVAADIAACGYQAAFIPHPSPRSVLLAQRAKIPIRIGWRGTLASPFLTERVPIDDTDTLVARRLRLVDATLAGPASQALQGGLRRSTPAHDGRLPRIGLVLGSAWATKRWPPERAAGFVGALDPRQVQLVLIGAEWERELFDGLHTPSSLPILAAAEVHIGGGVPALLDALETCDVVVAPDTGPMHAARALAVPVVAIFGPTAPGHHSFDAADRIVRLPIDCSPCGPHGHHLCPLEHHRCMVELPAADVLDAVASILGDGVRR